MYLWHSRVINFKPLHSVGNPEFTYDFFLVHSFPLGQTTTFCECRGQKMLYVPQCQVLIWDRVDRSVIVRSEIIVKELMVEIPV